MSTINFSRSRVASQGHSQHRAGTPKQQNKTWPIDFRHADDAENRKANYRCVLKAKIFNAWRFIGPCATARQIAQLLHLPLRTAEWGIALLKRQGFVANLRKRGLNGPMEVEFRILRSSTRETCGVKASRKVHTEKAKPDIHDTAQKTAALSLATPTLKIKPSRTPRQVFEVAKGLIGRDYAAWIYYRALRSGRVAGRTFAQSVPKSTAYYVKGYWNFCRQFEQHQHDAILENVGDRMQAEEDRYSDSHEFFRALDTIPRRWHDEAELPLQEVPKKKRAKRTKNACGKDHNYYSPCAACDAAVFGGAA